MCPPQIAQRCCGVWIEQLHPASGVRAEHGRCDSSASAARHAPVWVDHHGDGFIAHSRTGLVFQVRGEFEWLVRSAGSLPALKSG